MGKLGPEEQQLLAQMRAGGFKPAHQMPLDVARTMLAQMAGALSRAPLPIKSVVNEAITGPGGALPIRIYDPEPGCTSPRGVALFFHGGGFCVGNLETHDSSCRFLAAHARVPIVAVDYRLAPENKYPAALEDCYAALTWVASQGEQRSWDGKRIALIGDSAGAALVASLCLKAREMRGPAIIYQVLIYPGLALDDGQDFASRREFASGEYFLPAEDWAYFRRIYLGDPEREVVDPLVSPIRAGDFRGLPPALVLTAGFDPARDEGARYAELLEKAGVRAEYVCYESTIHGFFVFDRVLEAGRKAQTLVAERLANAIRH